MASKINSRLKSEKARSGKPYDRPKQSIFRKVASVVRDAIVPSWLLNVPSWGRYGEEETVPAAPSIETEAVPATTSIEPEVQDEVAESASEAVVARPSKRLRYAPDNLMADVSRPRTTMLFAPSTVNDSLSERVGNSTSQVAPSCELEKKEPQLIVNGDDHSENSEGTASTSGCSSLISSHVDKPDHSFTSLKLSENALESLRIGLKGKSFLRMKKDAAVSTENSFSSTCDRSASQSDLSLWSRDSNLFLRNTLRPQSAFHSSRPSFSLSSFAGPSATNSPLSAREKVSSPFYEGKTTYGGASAYRRAQLSSLPYQSSRTLRSKITVKPSQSGDDVECMSSAAKRILHTLEKMSTPLTDAKKIPNLKKSPSDISASFTPASQRFNSYLPLSRRIPMSAPYSKAPPVTSVTPSSRLNLLRNFSKICKNSKMEIPVRERSTVSLEQTIQSPLPDLEASKGGGGGKIRTRIHQHLHQSSKADDLKKMPEEVHLPSIPLPITDLPNISFTPKDKPKITVSEDDTKSSPTESVRFTFASPIDNSPPQPALQSRTGVSSPSYTFSSPVIVNDTTTNSISTKPSAGKEKAENKPEEEKETELYTASVDDFLKTLRDNNQKPVEKTSSGKENKNCFSTYKVDKELLEPVDTGFGDKFKPEIGSWECTSCLVWNKPDADNKCVACEASKPGSLDKQQSKAPSLGSMFMPPPGSWECPACLIRNKEDCIKCVACEALKPGCSAAPVEKVTPHTISGFGDKFKPPPGSWECPTCCVRNNACNSKCISCESKNPNASKDTDTNKDSKLVGFGDKFKPPPGSWECPTCCVRNTACNSKCISCESENPNASKDTDTNKNSKLGLSVGKPESLQVDSNKSLKGFLTSGMWKCDTCLVQNNPVGQSKCQACETPRISTETTDSKTFSGFKFGFAAPTSTTSFRFGSLVVNPISTAASTTFTFGDASETSKQQKSVQFGSTTLPATGSTVLPTAATEGFKFISPAPVTSTESGGFKFGVPTSDVALKPSEGLFKSEPASKSDKDSVSDSKCTPPSYFAFGNLNSNQNKSDHSKTVSTETSEVTSHKTEIETAKPNVLANPATTVQMPKPSPLFPSDTPASLTSISKTPCTTATSSAITTGGFIFGGSTNSSQSQSTTTFQFGNKTDDTVPSSSCATSSAQTTTVFTSTAASGSISSPSPFIFNSQPNKQLFAPAEVAAVGASVDKNHGMRQEAPVELQSAPQVSSSSTLSFPPSSAPSQATNFIFGSTSTPAATSSTSLFKFTPTVTTASAATNSTPKGSGIFSFGVPSSTETKDPKPGFSFASTAPEEKTQTLPQPQFTFNAFKQDTSSAVTTSTSTPTSSPFRFGATSTPIPASTGGFVFGAPKSDVSQTASSPFTFGAGTATKPLNSSSFGGFTPSQPVTTASVPSFNFGIAASNAAPVSGGFSAPNSNPSSLFSFGAKTTQATPTPVNNSGPLANPNSVFGSPASQSVFSSTSAIPSFGKPPEPKQETTGNFGFGSSTPSQGPVFRFGGNTQDGPQEKRHAAAPSPAGGFNFSLPQPSVMNNFNPTAPPSFNFGGTVPGATPLFQFNADSTTSGQNSGTRKIRKAVRRGVRKPD